MLAVTADGRRAYTANTHPGSLTEIDFSAGTTRMVILAPTVNRVSLSPDDRFAYVADQDLPRIAVVDLAQMRLQYWVRLPGIAFGTAAMRDGRHLVLTLRNEARLGVLDLASRETHVSTPLPPGPQRVVLNHDETTAFTTCSPEDAVVALDLPSMSVVAIANPGRDPDGLSLGPPLQSDSL